MKKSAESAADDSKTNEEKRCYSNPPPYRKGILKLDALVEILKKKRFIHHALLM
jgi:hypothetical protein